MKYITCFQIFLMVTVVFLIGCGETEEREPIIPVVTLDFVGYTDPDNAEFSITVKPNTKELPILVVFASEGKEPFHVWNVHKRGPITQTFTVLLNTSVSWEASIIAYTDEITKDYPLGLSGISVDALSEYVLGDTTRVTTTPLELSVDNEIAIPEGMVLIPEGEFQMGSDGDDAEDKEKPVHTVFVDAFYIDIHEVTIGDYSQFVKETGSNPLPPLSTERSPTNDHPVVVVSWHNAMAYAAWANKRLPTEAEWEKAARGGLNGIKYPWGDTAPDGTQCNYADKNTVDLVWNFDGTEQRITWADEDVDDGYLYNAPVGRFLPNPYGLYDMAGNVWEWCLDEYDEEFYANSPRENPISGMDIVDTIDKSLSITTARTIRGGSYASASTEMRSAQRGGAFPRQEYNNVGFRCVKPVKTELKEVGQ